MKSSPSKVVAFPIGVGREVNTAVVVKERYDPPVAAPWHAAPEVVHQAEQLGRTFEGIFGVISDPDRPYEIVSSKEWQINLDKTASLN